MDLFGNNLTHLPAELGNLTNLVQLDLRQNQLSTEQLPPELGRLCKLERLYLTKNNLATLPSEIKTMYSLKELDAANNMLISVPEEVGALVCVITTCLVGRRTLNTSWQTNLTRLNLSGNRLLTLPPTIALMTALNKLNIKSNEIHELPAEIGELQGLVKLDLSHNMMTKYAFPNAVF